MSSNIQVVTPAGEILAAEIVSVPSDTNPSPVQNDFVFLKLKQKPSQPVKYLALGTSGEVPILGDDVYFSGYPLATPGMVSHRGMISGNNPGMGLIFVEAPINKGNSGGGLINTRGHIVGLVSLREGGITQGLAALRGQIAEVSQHGSVTLMGINPLQTTQMLIDTVDQYISTGIGYARDIKFAREYLSQHPELLK